MAKFILKCPNCQEEFEYKFIGKEAAERVCRKCGSSYTISTRFTLLIFELFLFYFYVNQIQPAFLPYASIPTILIGMVGFCGGATVLAFSVLNHFLGAGFLFDVQLKKGR